MSRSVKEILNQVKGLLDRAEISEKSTAPPSRLYMLVMNEEPYRMLLADVVHSLESRQVTDDFHWLPVAAEYLYCDYHKSYGFQREGARFYLDEEGRIDWGKSICNAGKMLHCDRPVTRDDVIANACLLQEASKVEGTPEQGDKNVRP